MLIKKKRFAILHSKNILLHTIERTEVEQQEVQLMKKTEVLTLDQEFMVEFVEGKEKYKKKIKSEPLHSLTFPLLFFFVHQILNLNTAVM